MPMDNKRHEKQATFHAISYQFIAYFQSETCVALDFAVVASAVIFSETIVY